MARPAVTRRATVATVATVATMIGGDPPSERTPRKRGLPRFSLRRILYSTPLIGRRLNRSGPNSGSNVGSNVGPNGGPNGDLGGIPPMDSAPSASRQLSTESKTPPLRARIRQCPPSVEGTRGTEQGDDAPTTASPPIRECPLCLFEMPSECFPELLTCAHRSCYDCFQKYLNVEISESRVHVVCPECSEPMHPSDIRMILNDKVLFEKYEDFMVRRVLACDPDTRWCPAPDCCFAVIAAGCASCPKIKCERPGCAAHFCYHCKAEWHPNQTCDAARAQRSPNARSSSFSYCSESQHQDDLKPCPRCQILIVKINDGSCNHMKCSVCGVEFCWLCMKEVTDLHFLSPSGCTFWGKKPWSRKKKILWQLGTLVGAPVGIGLVAGIAVPAMIIGIPVWVGKKLYRRYKHLDKHKRNLYIVGGITAAIIVAPLLAALAVAIGAPILLFYVYGVVPVSMCRSGGCGGGSGGGSGSGTASRSGDDDRPDIFGDVDLEVVMNTSKPTGDISPGGHAPTNPSIGEVSISLSSGSNLERLGREGACDVDLDSRDTDADAELDRPSASNVAVAGTSITGSLVGMGNHHEVQADMVSNQRLSLASASASETASAVTNVSDDGAASTRALAGSVLNWRSDSASGVVNIDEETYGALAAAGGDRVRFNETVDILEERGRVREAKLLPSSPVDASDVVIHMLSSCNTYSNGSSDTDLDKEVPSDPSTCSERQRITDTSSNR